MFFPAKTNKQTKKSPYISWLSPYLFAIVPHSYWEAVSWAVVLSKVSALTLCTFLSWHGDILPFTLELGHPTPLPTDSLSASASSHHWPHKATLCPKGCSLTCPWGWNLVPPAGTSWPTSSRLGSGWGSTTPSLLQYFAVQPCHGMLNCLPYRTGGSMRSVTCSQRHRGGQSPNLLPQFPLPVRYHMSGFCSAHPPGSLWGPWQARPGPPRATWLTCGSRRSLGHMNTKD